MIFDRTGLFSDAQPITGTAFSTNTIDLGATGTLVGLSTAISRDVGKGITVPLACRAVQPFNNLTSLQIVIQVATDAAFTTPVTVYNSPAYSLTDLNPGSTRKYLLPDTIPVGTNQRYLRLQYVVTGTAPTTGAITAGVTMGDQTNSAL